MEAVRDGGPRSATQCPSCSAEVSGDRCAECGCALRAGAWTIQRVLSQNPHGSVYVASDESGRTAALKELRFANAANAEQVEAFNREVETLRQLKHPAIPKLVDSFSSGAGPSLRFYLAAELIRGESLQQRLEKGRLSEQDAIAVARAVLEILRFLHSRTPALLHRDIKPANIMFREDGRVMLVDFGSVRHLHDALTHRSTLVGTFGYMPIEQLGDRRSHERFVCAWRDRAPCGHRDAAGRPAGPGHEPEDSESISEPLRLWLSAALARNRADRFQDAMEALRGLNRGVSERRLSSSDSSLPGLVTRPAPVERRQVSWWQAALVIAAGLGMIWKVYTVEVNRPRVFANTRSASTRTVAPAPVAQSQREANAVAWWGRAKAQCNNVEVSLLMGRDPPPKDADGVGFGAACYALVGKLAEAHRLIDDLPSDARPRAAWRVFEVVHPVADRGDNPIRRSGHGVGSRLLAGQLHGPVPRWHRRVLGWKSVASQGPTRGFPSPLQRTQRLHPKRSPGPGPDREGPSAGRIGSAR